MRACTNSNNRGVGAVSSSRYLIMAGGFPFSSVPWSATNAAISLRNLGLDPEALAFTSNCSLNCNCNAGFEAFTDRSKCSALRYSGNDSSGAEVRRYCEPSSSTAAAGDQLSKSSNNSCTADILLAAFNASNCSGACICCQGQKPVFDANVTATSKQNPPNAALHSLRGQRICPKYCRELKTRKPTQEISLEFKPGSIKDAYSFNLLNKKSKDSDAVGSVEVGIYKNDAAAFTESICESGLQEDQNNDDNKRQEIRKGSKRKVREMERKVVAVEIQSGKNVDLEARIVRVSRLTGGKDRHSKVLTAKGLRDRRVRLSVSTAIQFYDLQDRLGLEQPSKAVDWLINAAKSSIDELPALDADMPSASAGNMTQLNSSNSSHLMHYVGSPRESATAAAASARTVFGFDEGTNSHKAIDGKAISITTMNESDLGRSNSSTSDGSVKGSAEYTSNCSMLKPDSKIEARLKARERQKKKTASAKNSGALRPAIHQLNSIQPSLSGLSKSVLPYATLPLEYQTSSTDDNSCGIQTQVFTGTGSVEHLWEYNTPSYTEILCTEVSQPLQNMASSSTAALQESFSPVPSSCSLHAVIGSRCLQSYEMADSPIPIFEPNQNRHLGSNEIQAQASLFYSDIPMFMKSVEQQQQQQQAQTRLKYFASMAVPMFSNDINLATSSLSSRGPLQSNSSITCMPSISETRKNAYDEASIKTAHFVPLQGYGSQTVFPATPNAGQRKV